MRGRRPGHGDGAGAPQLTGLVQSRPEQVGGGRGVGGKCVGPENRDDVRKRVVRDVWQVVPFAADLDEVGGEASYGLEPAVGLPGTRRKAAEAAYEAVQVGHIATR